MVVVDFLQHRGKLEPVFQEDFQCLYLLDFRLGRGVLWVGVDTSLVHTRDLATLISKNRGFVFP